MWKLPHLGNGHAIRICLYTLAIGALSLYGYSLYASALLRASDTITTSAPNAFASHTIQFTSVNAVPASGRIRITPQTDAFTIAPTMDYSDVDLAVSTSSSYTERTLAASASASDDGVAVVSGTTGSITITLASGEGIPAGADVRIKLGSIAQFGDSGDSVIRSPNVVGSYKMSVATQSADGSAIDGVQTMIAIVEPLSVTSESENLAPGRSNGLPSGSVAAGNGEIEISLETDELATCRYSTTAGVAYTSMSESFHDINDQLFWANVLGHVNNTTYTYYVKCVDIYGLANSDDYDITFTLDADPISNTSIEQEGVSGNGGVGPFPNGSSVLYLASVSIAGFTSPGSTVSLLKDGKTVSTVTANSAGEFSGRISNIERGTYSFSAFTTDRSARNSSTFSATLTLVQGTNNTIADAVIPPTIGLATEALGVGDDVHIIGESVPGADIELTLSRSGSPAKKYAAKAANNEEGKRDGDWEVVIPGNELSRGQYSARARASLSSQVRSEWSLLVIVPVGGSASSGIPGDLNGDGKVNLIDFSIMLTYWGPGESIADLNTDEVVNLSDFSILLFNWTG